MSSKTRPVKVGRSAVKRVRGQATATCETIRGEALQGKRNAAQCETHPGWRHTHDHILSLLTALVRSDYGTVYSVHRTERERDVI